MTPKEQAHYDRHTARLNEAHCFYREMLAAYEKGCIEHQLQPSRHDIDVAMEGISESYYEAVMDSEKALQDMGFIVSVLPDFPDKLKDAAYERIIDAFRIKPVKVDLLQMFKPMGEGI